LQEIKDVASVTARVRCFGAEFDDRIDTRLWTGFAWLLLPLRARAGRVARIVFRDRTLVKRTTFAPFVLPVDILAQQGANGSSVRVSVRSHRLAAKRTTQSTGFPIICVLGAVVLEAGRIGATGSAVANRTISDSGAILVTLGDFG
jgi:hypothetical protein